LRLEWWGVESAGRNLEDIDLRVDVMGKWFLYGTTFLLLWQKVNIICRTIITCCRPLYTCFYFHAVGPSA